MNHKSKLGQFYTTNSQEVLAGFHVPDGVHVVEPFCGKGDLLVILNDSHDISMFDIDPQNERTEQRDCLLDPPDYDDRFVLTNPPYLARNKSEEKTVFDAYNENDLFKCFIRSMLQSSPVGGIMILPVNFLSSVRKADVELRLAFMGSNELTRCALFDKQMFDDTSYDVCVVQFERTTGPVNDAVPVIVGGEELSIDMSSGVICPEIYALEDSGTYAVGRSTHHSPGTPTNLVVHCLDGAQPIRMELTESPADYVDNTERSSCRTRLLLSVHPAISHDQQRRLARDFNSKLNSFRQSSASLFLPGFRDHGRKRIPFELVYTISRHCLQ